MEGASIYYNSLLAVDLSITVMDLFVSRTLLARSSFLRGVK